MLIRDTEWEAIREQFSEDEKSALRSAVQGQAICPKGFIIDENKLNVTLEFKITQAMSVQRRRSIADQVAAGAVIPRRKKK